MSIRALLDPTLLQQALGGQALHPHVVTAVQRVASAFEPSTQDMGMRSTVSGKILAAFLAEGVTESDLPGTSGYGYHDSARERYEAILARVYRAERALARVSIVSGTHAIVVSLAALARPGTCVVSATGTPYDTLHHAITGAAGSLCEQGVLYAQAALDAQGNVNLAALEQVLSSQEQPISVVFIQRSRGYAPRPSLSMHTIARIVMCVRRQAPSAHILVDNCYCELLEAQEPLEVGADLVMGSLIKNLGGGLAPAGGYVAGKALLIEKIATRLYAPGLGAALGPTLGLGRLFLQGLFQAPQVVWESIRGLRFWAALFSELGYEVEPTSDAARFDIVQAIRLGDKTKLEQFARALQTVLPINARFRPEPGPVPGYVDQVIMSGGSFIAGATIELSCDAPLRPPYEMYVQGGLSAEHIALGAIATAHALAVGSN